MKIKNKDFFKEVQKIEANKLQKAALREMTEERVTKTERVEWKPVHPGVILVNPIC